MPYCTKQKKITINVKNPFYHFTAAATDIVRRVTEHEDLEFDGGLQQLQL